MQTEGTRLGTRFGCGGSTIGADVAVTVLEGTVVISVSLAMMAGFVEEESLKKQRI